MNQTSKMTLSSPLTIPSMEPSLSSSSSSPIPSSQSDDFYITTLILLLGPLIEIIGSSIIQRWFIPAYIQTSPQRIFKWRSTLIARITAGITGIMVSCIYKMVLSPKTNHFKLFASHSDILNG